MFLIESKGLIMFVENNASVVSAFIKRRVNSSLGINSVRDTINKLEIGESVTYEYLSDKRLIRITRVPSVNEIGHAFVKTETILNTTI